MPTPNTPQEFAQAIADAGISTSDIAEKTGVDKSTITRILAGTIIDPKYSTVEALKKLYASACKRGGKTK